MNEESNIPVVDETEVDEVESNLDDIETTNDMTEEAEDKSASETDEGFLNITYNKADMSLSKDKTVELAQKGMNYDKVLEKLQSYEKNPAYKYIEELMKQNGINDPNEYMKLVEQEKERAKQQELIDKYSRIHSPEIAKKLAEQDMEIARLKERNQKADSEMTKNKEYSDAIKWVNTNKEKGTIPEDFDINNLPKEVWEYKDMGMSLTEGLKEYLISNMKVLTEQATLKKLENKSKTSTGSIKDSNPETDERWSAEYIEKMAREKGSKWVNANIEKIESLGYYK